MGRMKTTNLKILLAVFALVLTNSDRIFAQADIHFSQFYETSILRNPALTGVFADDYKLGVYHRNQWNSITNPYNTFLVTGETHFQVNQSSEDFLSIGLLAFSDKAGSIDQKMTALYPAINYNKALDPDHNTFLSFGFTGGYLQHSFDPNKATFNNQYVGGKFSINNPTNEILPRAKLNLWDIGAGINFNTSRGENHDMTYVVGISAYHFTQPKYSYYQQAEIKYNMRLNGNAGVSGVLTDVLSYQVHLNYAMQGTYREIMLGGIMNWVQKSLGPNDIFVLSGGLFYRFQDALIPVVKVSYKQIAAGVSYDVNVSSLKDASKMQGGYEFTLFYTGNYGDKGLQKKTVCPKF